MPGPTLTAAAARAREPRLAELAAAQHGVLSRAQLRAAGVSRNVVRAQAQAGRWRPLGRHVVVLTFGELTDQQRRWAGVLAAGEGAVLGGLTVLQAAGLRGWDYGRVHVLTARGTRNQTPPPEMAWLVVRSTGRLGPEDVHPVRLPPQVRIERAAVDAARWSASARTGCGLLVAVVQQRLTTPARLSSALAEAGRIRYAVPLRRVLLDVQGGAGSLGEVDLAGLCRRHGLPGPFRQRRRRDSRGRRRYVDAWFRRRDGRVVHVEIDGALHLEIRTWWADQWRQNELALTGEILLRFPSVALYVDEEEVARQLRLALG